MCTYQKSNNLQYNTLGCKVIWTKDSSTKRLMFQVLFIFQNFLQNSLENHIKSFVYPKSMRNYRKNNAWNIGRLVDDSFVPGHWTSTQAYYIVDWRILRNCMCTLHIHKCLSRKSLACLAAAGSKIGTYKFYTWINYGHTKTPLMTANMTSIMP